MSGEAYPVVCRYAADAIREAADLIRAGEGENDEDITAERIAVADILATVYPLVRMVTYHASDDQSLDPTKWRIAMMRHFAGVLSATVDGEIPEIPIFTGEACDCPDAIAVCWAKDTDIDEADWELQAVLGTQETTATHAVARADRGRFDSGGYSIMRVQCPRCRMVYAEGTPDEVAVAAQGWA